MSEESNVYPLLPGTRIRLEKVGEINDDGSWREIHRHQFGRIQSYDIYMNRTTQRRWRRASQPSRQPVKGVRQRRRDVTIQHIQGRQEKDCVVCSDRATGQRRRSRTQCTRCLKGLHFVCLNQHLCVEE